MAKQTISLRLSDALREDLRRAAERQDTTVSALLERYAREGLAIDGHPGIVFRGGPGGRRAGLAAGPDVWEIIARLRELRGGEEERIATLAEESALHPRQIRIAVDYAAVHPEKVDELIESNERAAEESRRIAAQREALLG